MPLFTRNLKQTQDQKKKKKENVNKVHERTWITSNREEGRRHEGWEVAMRRQRRGLGPCPRR